MTRSDRRPPRCARLTKLTGRQVPGGMLPGCHDDAFWARNMPAALRFLAARYP